MLWDSHKFLGSNPEEESPNILVPENELQGVITYSRVQL